MHFARLEEPYMILDTYLSHDFWHVGINTHTGMHWKVPSLMKKQLKSVWLDLGLWVRLRTFQHVRVCVSGLETQKDNIFFCFLYFYFVQMNQKRKKNKNLSSCNFFPLLKHTQVYPQNVQYKSNLYIYRILICILWIEMEKNVFFCFF